MDGADAWRRVVLRVLLRGSLSRAWLQGEGETRLRSALHLNTLHGHN